MTPTQPNESPPRERPTVSGGIQLAAILGCAIVCGLIDNWGETWPAWALYPPALLFAFTTRFVIGVIFEKPNQFLPMWRALHWRVLWFESIVWSWSLVFFLSALHASEKKNGFVTLLFVGIIYLIVAHLSKNLVSTFRCPHCHQFFFKRKAVEGEKGLYPFSLTRWPNTLCQNCAWPLEEGQA